MINFISHGDSVSHTPSSAVSAGDVVVLSSRCAVAATDIAANQPGTVMLRGVFQLPKEAPLVIAQGAQLYYDVSEDKVTTTSTDNVAIGTAHEAAVSAATTVLVRLV